MRRILISLSFVFALAGCGSGADVNVLFVGNSFTHFHNMPGMVEEIAAANGVTVDTEMIAPGGALLSGHVNDPAVAEAIASGDFDIVVFQEQSQAPAVGQMAAEQTRPAARTLDRMAANAGVDVIWYQTWGHDRGFPEFGLGDYGAMQEAINSTYDALWAELGGDVARVGEAWSVARSALSINLYDPDGYHPSPAGSYLAALVLTDTIIEAPAEVAPAVGAVTEDTAQQLLDITN